MNYPPVPRYLVPPTPQYLSHHPFLKHPYPVFFSQFEETSFTSIQNNKQNCTSVYFNLNIFGLRTGMPKVLIRTVVGIPQVQSVFNLFMNVNLICYCGYRSQTQLVHILFIARYSLKLTACFGLSSIRPSSGHKYFIEKTTQYMLQYLNQFIVVQRDPVFRP